MEGIEKSRAESLIDNLRASGKVRQLTIEESCRIDEKINNNMKEFKIELRKREFEAKIAAEKILLTIKK